MINEKQTLAAEADLSQGAYPGLPFGDYAEIGALNGGALLDMSCPALFRWRRDNPKPMTDSMRLGIAIHAAVLEPEVFEREFVCYRGRRAGKAWAEFQELQSGASVILTEAQMSRAIGAATALRESATDASWAMTCPGDNELSFVWEDRGAGVWCKGRADRVVEGPRGPLVLDLKTMDTEELDAETVRRRIASFGYHIKAAWYLDGLTAATGERHEHYAFVFCAQQPPHLNVFVSLDPSAIETGRREYGLLLARYVECRKSGVWPGPSGFQAGLPRWYRSPLDED